MPQVKILLDDKARKALKAGIDETVDTVRVTLGPKGKNVVIKEENLEEVKSVNDGIYILRRIGFKDQIKNAGAIMIREISEKTNTYAGDATTTTAILAQEIYNEGEYYVNKGVSAVDIKNQMNDLLPSIKERLEALSLPLATNEMIEQVATIAANNDNKIGGAIAEIMEKAGRKAQITVEKSDTSDIETKIVKGLYWDDGYYSSRFLEGDISGKQEFKDAYILLTDYRIQYLDEILPFLQKIQEEGFNPEKDKLIVIAQDVEGDALAFFRSNFISRARNTRGEDGKPIGFFNMVVKAPAVGADQFTILEDFAIFCGGQVISQKSGISFKEAGMDVLGRAGKVMIDRNSTAIIDGAGDKEIVKTRIKAIEADLAQLKPMEKIIRENTEKRLQRLTSGVGIISAGGVTEIEVRDRHLRIEDAVLATRSADEEGIVAGGGITYLNLSRSLNKTVGGKILAKAFESITRQIILNAGKKPRKIMKKLSGNSPEIGYNAKTGEYCNMIDTGIIDSSKVIRVAIQNAISMASLLLITDAVIVGDTEK